MSECRCGWEPGDGSHPCHGGGYTCTKPATRRLVCGLASFDSPEELRTDVTFACDECWVEFQRLVQVALINAERIPV